MTITASAAAAGVDPSTTDAASGPPNNGPSPGQGTLTITLPDGRTGTVSVDSSFASLSPDQQHATVDEITKSLAPDSGFGADLKAGFSGAMDATGAAFQGVGGVLQRNGLPGGDALSGAGDWLRSNAPAVPQGYHSRGGDILSDLGQGNYSRAAGDVVHGVVEGAPVAAGALGAGAALDAVGIPAAAGAALIGGVTGLGAGAESRATAVGRATPNTDDVVGALPRAAVDALSSGATFGRLPPGVAGRVATGAAAGAGQSAVDQYDTTGSVDPSQVANAAITTGATVGATELPGAAAWGAKAVSDKVMAATLDKPATTEDAASILRVNADMNAVRDNAVRSAGTAPPDTAVANSVKAEYATKLSGIAQGWLKAGLIDRDDYRDLSALVNNQALRHNNTIAEGTDDLPTLFSQVDALDNVPDAARATFKDGVRDLNTISSQSFIKNTVGPVQRVAQLAGTWGPAASALMSGNPLAAAAAAMGHGVTGKVAGALGAKVDQALGLNTPPVVLQAINAVKALKKAGIDPATIQGSLPALQGVSGRSMPTGTITGLPANAVPVNTPIRGAGFTMTDAPTSAPSTGVPQQFRPSTPSDVALALQQDGGGAPGAGGGPIDPITAARLRASIGRLQGGSRESAEAPVVSPATTLPAGPPATPTGPLSLPAAHPTAPLWEQVVGSNDPNLTREQVRDAAGKVYSDEMIDALDGTKSFSSADHLAAVVAPILDRLKVDGGGNGGNGNGGNGRGGSGGGSSFGRGGFTPGSRFIANAVPGMDHAGAVEVARAAELVGRVPAGTADLVANSPAPLDARLLGAVRDHALEQVGIPPAAPGASSTGQWAVDRSQQARVNAAEYQNNARALAQANPDIAGTILGIAQSAKTPESKTAMARAFYGQHPEHIGRLPDWLLNHGHRG